MTNELAVKNPYGYLWITLAFFLLSFVGQWLFGWFAYVNEQSDLNAPVQVSDYFFRLSRDTLENCVAIEKFAHE